MAQEITQRQNTELVTPDERNIYERYSDAVNANRIVGELLKYSKGEWLAGRDGEEVALGTRFVVGIDKLQVGWIHWWDGKPSESQMGYLSNNFVPPRRHELGDDDPAEWQRDEATGLPRDPWQPSSSAVLLSVKGNRIYTMAASSKGSIACLGKLAGIYGKHMRMQPDELPMVALGTDSYKHSNKAFGKIHIPVLTVTGWVARVRFDELLAREVEAMVEGEEEAAPRKRGAKAAGEGGDTAAARGKRQEAPPTPAPARNLRYAGEGEDVPF